MDKEIKDKEIKNNVMSKIKKDEINIKSRWFFLARKLGLQSGLVLTLIVLIFLTNAFFYYIKSNELLMPLHYGPALWQKIVHSLPYDLILIIILVLLLFNYFLKKFDFSYKRPLSFIIAAFIIFIIFSALALFSSQFNNLLKREMEDSVFHIPYVSNFYIHRCPQQKQPAAVCALDVKLCPDGSYVSRIPPDCAFDFCPKENLIQIENLQANQVIASPLIIKGRARGFWFFEADFPIKLLDENGEVLAIGIARAQTDWMTSNFVPFSAILEFEAPSAGGGGFLIFEKDNPSGLPENADQLAMPVFF